MPYTLPPEETLNLQQALRKLDELDEICRRAAGAGVDTTAQDMMCQALRQRVDGLLREFAGRRGVE